MTRSFIVLLAIVGNLAADSRSDRWAALGKLTADATIEVVTATQTEHGSFVSSSTESVTIQTSTGERKFLRPDVLRVRLLSKSHRVRNVLIGAGIGAGIGLVTDQTLGTYLRNESNPGNARALIWTVPMAVCAGVAALFPSHPVIYRQ